MRKLFALTIATAAAIVGLTASPSSAGFTVPPPPPATIVYHGPGAGTTFMPPALISGTHSKTGALAAITTVSSTCTLAPSGIPGVYVLDLVRRGVCTLWLHVDAGGGYPAIDTTQNIGVAL